MLIMRRERRYDEIYNSFIRKLVGGDVVVNLPDVNGSFEIDVRSHILKAIIRNGCYEPQNVSLIKRHLRIDRDALDIGANIGIFTVFMAKLLASPHRVLSIEPTPDAIRHLLRNLDINGCMYKVIHEQKAATGKKGTYSISIIAGMEEYSTLRHMVLPDTRGKNTISVSIEGETVDALVEKHGLTPGFMKIDTEGCEGDILAGASQTLRKFHPAILSELDDRMLCNFGATSGEVLKFLNDHGYTVSDAYRPDKPIEYPFTGEILALPVHSDRRKK